MSNLMLIVVGGVLVNNFVMSQFLGICPFLGVSKKTETALGMGMAVTFVMAIASLFTFFVQRYLLIPLKLEYMQTIAFILIIAVLVQTVEIVLKKMSRALYQALGVYLPLITTNCAVLGVTILNITEGYNLLYSVLNGTFGALGFLVAIVLMAGVRERLETAKIAAPLKGFPISLVIAGLMSIAFLGFSNKFAGVMG